MKKLSKLAFFVCAMVLFASCAYTSFGTLNRKTTVSAFDMAAGTYIPSKVTLGKEVALADAGVTLIVKDPTGKVVDPANDGGEDAAKYRFNMIGYYTANYYDGVSNMFEGVKILVESVDPVFVIPFNGAEIKTNIAKGTGFTVPKATLAVYDEDGELDNAETIAINGTATITVSLTSPKDGTSTVLTAGADGSYDVAASLIDSTGMYIVRYKAVNGDLIITKDFEVKSHTTLPEGGKPVLNVSSVSSEANQNTKITLPKATATDDIDTNVKISITVTGPKDKTYKTVATTDVNGNVMAVNDVDERNLFVETFKQEFDNDKNMSFYPMAEGNYEVTYIAENDADKTMKSVFKINVSDKKAPVFDTNDYIIPSKWGLEITRLATTAPDTFEVLPIIYPAPVAYDNVTASVDLAYTFKLKDTQNKDFFSLSIDKSGAVTTTPATEAEVTALGVKVVKTNDKVSSIEFKPNSYAPTYSKLGTYSATYTAKDEKGNSASSMSYNTVVSEKYEDMVAPSIDAKNIPDYIFVGDKFTRLDITAKDANDSSDIKLDVEYKFEGTDFFTSDTEKEKVFTTAGKITVTATAYDKVGNEATWALPTAIDVINDVVDTVSVPGNPSIDAPAITMPVAADQSPSDADNKAILKNITITSAASDKFTGFEVTVREPGTKTVDGAAGTYKGAGSLVNATVVYTNDNAGAITIKELSFEADRSGDYIVAIRAFSVTGASSFEFFTVASTVTDSGSNPISPLAFNSKIPTEMSAGEVFALPRYKATDAGSVLVTKISGKQFSISANRFTPVVEGSYSITYGAEKAGSIKYDSPNEFTVADKSVITFKLMEEFASYTKKWVNPTGGDVATAAIMRTANGVEIPKVSVISKAGVSKLDTKVTFSKKGGSENEKQTIETVDGVQFFRPLKDGEYTITYTATSQSGTKDFTLKIMSGDLIQPTITLTASPKTGYKIGDTFSFADFFAADNVDGSTITYSRKVIGPDKSTLYTDSSNTASDSAVYKFDLAGTYRIIYEARDDAGNVATEEFTVEITDKADSKVNTRLLSIVLIVTAVLLFISMFVYFFVFRKTKE